MTNSKRIQAIKKSIALQNKLIVTLAGSPIDMHAARESCKRVLEILQAQLQVASMKN